MSNNTSSSDRWSNIFNNIIYICQGIFIGPLSLLIVVVVSRYSALRTRKEYLIIAGQALADALNQFAFVAAGIYRISLIINDKWDTKITPSECMTNVHSILWLWVYPLTSLMLAVTSLDRLLSVSFPLEYIGWPITYTWTLLIVAYGYAISMALFIAIFIFTDSDDAMAEATASTSRCIGHGGLEMMKTYRRITVARVFPGIALLLYVLVWLQYKRNQERQTTNVAEQKREIKIQRKFTISIGVSCVCTLFLWIVPAEMAYIFMERHEIMWATIFFAMANLNPLCNVIIYPLYHQSIRQGIEAFFHCKMMPQDIRMWKTNKEAQNATKEGRISVKRALKMEQQRPKIEDDDVEIIEL